MSRGYWGIGADRRQLKYSERNLIHHTLPTWTGLGLNVGDHCVKLVSNCLSHGMSLFSVILSIDFLKISLVWSFCIGWRYSKQLLIYTFQVVVVGFDHTVIIWVVCMLWRNTLASWLWNTLMFRSSLIAFVYYVVCLMTGP